jgi:hypothetical protein
MKLLKKIKNLIFQKPENVNPKPMNVVTTIPSSSNDPNYFFVTNGDRKRYFDSFNQDLLNRISDIKSQNS